MRSRLHLALAVAAGLVAAPLAAQPVAQQPVAQQTAAKTAPPALQRLADGTLSIVPCPGAANQGCVEILFDGETPPAACWTLPPFGTAVKIETVPGDLIAGSSTRRMTILLDPLDQVPPATPATLRFGFPRAGASLACDQTVVVQRPAGILALPAELDLGDLRVDLWGGVGGVDRVQAVFAAPGQPAIGPLKVSSQASLYAAGRRGSPVPVMLDLPDDAMVTAGSFAELTLAPRSTGWFPALGPLTGQVWVTAPQLVQPFALTLKATSQIGWWSILAVLVLGIAVGWGVRRNILPRQVLARARLEAGRAFVAARAVRDRQRDKALAQDLETLITKQEQVLASAEKQEDVATAVKDLTQAMDQTLKDADARRQKLADATATPLAALRALPVVSELPMPPLNAWADALDKARILIEDGEIARPAALIDTTVAQAEKQARAALMEFADASWAPGIRDLGDWTRPAACQAFGPVTDAGKGFLLPPDLSTAALLTTLRDAHHGLRQAVATQYSAIAQTLRPLAAGARTAGFPDAVERTNTILDDLDRRPVAALTALAGLVRDYDDYARSRGGTSFEALADFKGLERLDSVPPAERRIDSPEAPIVAIQTDPRLPVAGQDLAISPLDLPAGHVARIWTPYGSAQVGGPGDPPLKIRPRDPGVIPVQIVLADAQGHVLSRHTTTLTVQPASDHAIPGLEAEARTADQLAIAAAAALSLLSGLTIFWVVPLTSWVALMTPFLWGFFVNLSLPDTIQGLQARRDAALKALNIS
ncbi:hypothetical protein [uncultured Paracoccus sp.]|uniref:hypothetical protein n=1 Tax=uncultured Paracoccus sp. TaxID=189685 RepID=UPI0025DFE420|nr:hypothetical protein [uncultured Paracoccus sp.]